MLYWAMFGVVVIVAERGVQELSLIGLLNCRSNIMLGHVAAMTVRPEARVGCHSHGMLVLWSK